MKKYVLFFENPPINTRNSSSKYIQSLTFYPLSHEQDIIKNIRFTPNPKNISWKMIFDTKEQAETFVQKFFNHETIRINIDHLKSIQNWVSGMCYSTLLNFNELLLQNESPCIEEIEFENSPKLKFSKKASLKFHSVRWITNLIPKCRSCCDVCGVAISNVPTMELKMRFSKVNICPFCLKEIASKNTEVYSKLPQEFIDEYYNEFMTSKL